MLAPGYDPRYEPSAVKAAIPVEWALGELFGVWGVGTAMIECPLPGHVDDTASFNLWAPNEDGMPMRFGCFGCGENGDVIDLIRLGQNLNFTDACTFAIDTLLPRYTVTEWVPTADGFAATIPATPEDLEVALAHLNYGETFLDAFIAQKEAKAELLGLPRAFTQLWGWHGAYVGMPVLVLPHRDWDGQLRGVRYRSIRRGNRWTEKGSRFDVLYGAWRDEGRPAVLLAEGETDTVYAAWQLRDRPYDVLGLPSGAAQKPHEESVARLAGRTVWIAFDADLAGNIASARWQGALSPLSDVRIVKLPEGEDISSVGVGIESLMEAS